MSSFYLSQLGETKTGKDRLPHGQKVTWSEKDKRRDRQKDIERRQRKKEKGGGGESGQDRERKSER